MVRLSMGMVEASHSSGPARHQEVVRKCPLSMRGHMGRTPELPR
jgi:hypothetical protein